MDLRFALRSLWKNPGFAVLAVLVMGLGIGANTAVFSVVNAVLLKPLDYHEPERIMTLWSLWQKSGNRGQVSGPDFHDWHDQSTAFSAMSYYYDFDTAVSAGSAAEYAHVAAITPEFLQTFAIQPSRGRPFVADEQKPGGTGAVLIGYAFWQRHFDGNATALGQTVRVFGKPLVVVGVLPAGFGFPDHTDVWYPANVLERETASRSAHNYRVIGRLKAGVSIEEARSQMVSIASRLEKDYPSSNHGKSAAVVTLRESMVGDVRPTLLLLLGAVVLVLLIACANVANLLLAKATSRTREMAIRAAVGASRSRLIRQLTMESMVLALVSGAVGLLLACWVSSALVALAPQDIPRLAETAIDARVLAFTFGTSLVASLLFGLFPAWQTSQVDLNDSLKMGGARTTSSGVAARMRGALVVAEIAISVVLLAGAGLLIRSFVVLHNVALGFHPENVLVMGTSVPAYNLEMARRAAPFFKEVMTEAAALPGVIAVGGTRMPPGKTMSNGGYWLDHPLGPETIGVSLPQAVFSVVTPGLFNSLGIPLRLGRDFSARDSYEAPGTAIINEALARASFPGQDPLGRTIFCGFDKPSMQPMEIVGVVGNIRQDGPASEERPEIYMPFEQHPGASTGMKLVVRTTSDPLALADGLRRKVQALSSDVPVTFTTLEASLAENVAAPRFRTVLLAIFAALAALLAMAGVYGVMAYVVGQRTAEIGLRMALGADPRQVMGMVLTQGLKLAAIGIAIGLAVAVGASRVLTKVLFSVKPTDPATYAAVAVLLAAVALAACYVPARRATKVDPLVALRQD